MTGETILVVDDHPPNLALMSHLLGMHGYDVVTAADARETLAKVSEKAPRLVLMDLQLPGMDGFELTRMLKARPDMAGVPVIAVTSFALSGDKDRALAAGCDSYVAKPIDTRTLPGLVARHLAAG